MSKYTNFDPSDKRQLVTLYNDLGRWANARARIDRPGNRLPSDPLTASRQVIKYLLEQQGYKITEDGRIKSPKIVDFTGVRVHRCTCQYYSYASDNMDMVEIDPSCFYHGHRFADYQGEPADTYDGVHGVLVEEGLESFVMEDFNDGKH